MRKRQHRLWIEITWERRTSPWPIVVNCPCGFVFITRELPLPSKCPKCGRPWKLKEDC